MLCKRCGSFAALALRTARFLLRRTRATLPTVVRLPSCRLASFGATSCGIGPDHLIYSDGRDVRVMFELSHLLVAHVCLPKHYTLPNAKELRDGELSIGAENFAKLFLNRGLGCGVLDFGSDDPPQRLAWLCLAIGRAVLALDFAVLA